jgi:hypothetical protein
MSGRERDHKVRHRPARPPDRRIRSLVLCVDLVGSRRLCLLRLGASSVASGPDGSRRIVWMTKPMINQGRQLGHLTAADLDSAVDPHPPTW